MCTTSQRPPIKARNSCVNSSERKSQRNFIPREDWLRIPEDVRKLLTSGTSSDHQDRSNHEIHHTSLASNDTSADGIYCNNITTNDYDRNENDSTVLINALINRTQLTPDQVDNAYNAVVENDRIGKGDNYNSDTIIIHGVKYCRTINIVNITYTINKSTRISGYSLIDRGANGGLFGSDVCIINHTNRKVTITGIDNHQVGDLPICTGAGLGYTHKGPVIFIMHQYAFLGQGKTIHSSNWM
jgi:hypothetical protein